MNKGNRSRQSFLIAFATISSASVLCGQIAGCGSESDRVPNQESSLTKNTSISETTSALGSYPQKKITALSVVYGPPSLDGICGSSNGAFFPSPPTTNLCNNGTASTPSGTGPWYWTCAGATNENITASCSAHYGSTHTKAKVFMTGDGDHITVRDNGATVYGSSRRDTITITSRVTGVKTDANIERIELDDSFLGYKFIAVAGAGIQIRTASGDDTVVTIPSLNQETTIVFDNGSAPLVQTGSSTFTLGGQAISTTTAGSVTALLNSADRSTTSSSISHARVFLGVSDHFSVRNSGTTVYGSSGIDIITIPYSVNGVKTDANIERIELAGNLSDYKFIAVAGAGIEIQIQGSTGVVVVTIPSLNQDTTIAFADGSALLVQTGSSAFTLGGQAISTTTSGSVSATLNTADKSMVGN
jgi:hypothetical protein